MDALLLVFRILASCTSLMMLLSPVVMVLKFRRERSTGVMSIVPLASMLINSHMWMIYGYLDDNYFPVFFTFVIGDVLAVSYLVVFFRHAIDRQRAHRVLAITAVLLVLMTLYLFLGANGLTGQSSDAVAQTAGILAILTGAMLYSSPLDKIRQVFRHKSAVFIPIHMVCAGSTNNATWLTYSLLAKKWLITGLAGSSLCVGVFQIVLYFCVFHPSTHPYVADEGDVEAQDVTKPDGSYVSFELQTPTTKV